ncbi:Dynein heavy chain [Glycine soja]
MDTSEPYTGAMKGTMHEPQYALAFRGLHVLAFKGLHVLAFRGLHALAFRGLHVLASRGQHVLAFRGPHALAFTGLHVLAFRELHVLAFRELHVLVFRGLHVLAFKGVHVLAFRGVHVLAFRGLHIFAFRGLHVLAFRGLHILAFRGLHALAFSGLQVLAFRGLHIRAFRELKEGQPCEHNRRRRQVSSFDEEAITQLLCIPGQDFTQTTARRRVLILRTNMTTLTQIWMMLLLSNILPSDHDSDFPLSKDRAHKTPSGPEEVQQGPGISSSNYGPLSILRSARCPQQGIGRGTTVAWGRPAAGNRCTATTSRVHLNSSTKAGALPTTRGRLAGDQVQSQSGPRRAPLKRVPVWPHKPTQALTNTDSRAWNISSFSRPSMDAQTETGVAEG